MMEVSKIKDIKKLTNDMLMLLTKEYYENDNVNYVQDELIRSYNAFIQTIESKYMSDEYSIYLDILYFCNRYDVCCGMEPFQSILFYEDEIKYTGVDYKSVNEERIPDIENLTKIICEEPIRSRFSTECYGYGFILTGYKAYEGSTFGLFVGRESDDFKIPSYSDILFHGKVGYFKTYPLNEEILTKKICDDFNLIGFRLTDICTEDGKFDEETFKKTKLSEYYNYLCTYGGLVVFQQIDDETFTLK